MNLTDKKIRIGVLPVAGKEDPTQMLMMQAVSSGERFEMQHGVHARFFPATRTCLKLNPDILYFDWIGRYLFGRTRIITWFKIATFWLDVQVATHLFRRPIVWSLHNLQSHEQGENSRHEQTLQRYFAQQTTLIRVFSQSAVARASKLLGASPAKLRVVPVGNYIAYYPNAINLQEARTRLGLKVDDFVLLWLGSIRPYKGLQELIEAFRRVARPNWRLVIAGKPYIESYAREISAFAQGDDRIQLHYRFIPEDELQVYYNAANAVALPFAEVENTSSLVVAMGFRKPVVAPNLGVIGERLHRQPELVYTPGNLDHALAALAKLSPDRIIEMGAANFDEVSRFTWSDIAGVFHELENNLKAKV